MSKEKKEEPTLDGFGEGTETPKEAKKTVTKEPEQTTLSTEQYEALMGRMSEMEGEISGFKAKEVSVKEEKKSLFAPKKTKRTARVWFLNDKLVVKYGKSFEKKDPIDGSKIFMMELYTEDGEMSTVEYIPFRQNLDNIKVGEIIETKEDWETLSQDFPKVKKVVLSKDEWSMEESNQWVTPIVKIPNHTYVIKLEDGSKVEVLQGMVN